LELKINILSVENTTFNIDNIPDEIEDLRFCVLDNSNPKNPDYFFLPLIFLESFNTPALVLKIGEYTLKMPVDWQILIGEPDLGDLEIVPLTSVNDRGFKAFSFNPLGSFRPKFLEIEILDVFQDVKWYFPKLKNNHLLTVPLSDGPNPDCVYFIKDVSRQSEIVDIGKVW
jgi:hypothetical protein